MTISDLIPTLQPTVQTISTQLRFICFFVLVAAMIVRTGAGNTDITHLLRPLTTNAIVCAFLATLPFWFNTARDSFWAIAVQIQQDFTGSIADTGTKLMQQLQPPDGQINWLDVTGVDHRLARGNYPRPDDVLPIHHGLSLLYVPADRGKPFRF
jgi:hypothetical protein